MNREDRSPLYEIDNLVRETMTVLDRRGRNYFSEHFSLIMDFTPYVERVVIGKLMRTPNHRIILVRQGSATISFNMESHQLRRGSMVLVPANTIISMRDVSPDYGPIDVSFLSSRVDSMGLVGYKVLQMQLSEKEMKTMQNYYTLLEALAEKGEISNGSMDFLLMSLLVHIHEVSKDLCSERWQLRTNKACEVADKFLYILNSEVPVRSVDHYAGLLSVTPVYLRNAVSKFTGHTPSKWISERIVREIQLLLTDSERYYGLEEIAEKANCGSAQQLVKFFKKHTGITPNAYRKKFQ